MPVLKKTKKREELNEILKASFKKCPQCDGELEFAYFGTGYPLMYGQLDRMSGVKRPFIILSGLGGPIQAVPAALCRHCGIVIGQVRDKDELV